MSLTADRFKAICVQRPNHGTERGSPRDADQVGLEDEFCHRGRRLAAKPCQSSLDPARRIIDAATVKYMYLLENALASVVWINTQPAKAVPQVFNVIESSELGDPRGRDLFVVE
jgi:hypothetical protein